jgi:hypothetical protein
LAALSPFLLELLIEEKKGLKDSFFGFGFYFTTCIGDALMNLIGGISNKLSGST